MPILEIPMYEYIRGKLIEATPLKTVVEVSGIGYSLLIPVNHYSNLPPFGKDVTFYLSLIVREDAHLLYGFLSRAERDLFERLITVSGIGPKTALALIGHLEAADLQLAVSQGNLTLLCKVPGIGKKTAERLIVDMRDKFKKEPLTDLSSKHLKGSSSIPSDALNALIHLGYNPLYAQKAIKTALDASEEELALPKLITAALRCL